MMGMGGVEWRMGKEMEGRQSYRPPLTGSVGAARGDLRAKVVAVGPATCL